MDEEYELLSHEEVERLKKEAERHKRNPFIKGHDDELYSLIVDLTKAINKLYLVFEDVKQKIIQEQVSGEGPDAKMNKLLEQNMQIARTLVNFGEKMDVLISLNSQKAQPSIEDKDQQIPQQQNEQQSPNAQQINEVPEFKHGSEDPNKKDIDYTAWNYSDPTVPGVSKSNPSDLPNFNEFSNQKQTYKETIPQIKPVQTDSSPKKKKKRLGIF